MELMVREEYNMQVVRYRASAKSIEFSRCKKVAAVRCAWRDAF